MGTISDTRVPIISIEPASAIDLLAIVNLLTESELPPAGVSEHLTTAVVARAGDKVVGCAVLELYDRAALLRSVAVGSAYRGCGLGQRLTQVALEMARRQEVTHVYLLTETAGEFFPKFGFRSVDRSQVPPAVQNSIEFTSLCPVSALAMELSLDQTGEK